MYSFRVLKFGGESHAAIVWFVLRNAIHHLHELFEFSRGRVSFTTVETLVLVVFVTLIPGPE